MFDRSSAALVSRPQARAVSYRRLVVCLSASDASTKAVGVACTLAAERDALVTALAAIEVPLGLPLETPDRAAEAAAREAVHAAQAVAASFGVPVEGVVLHARDAGEAIVAETTLRDAEIVLIAEPGRSDRDGGQLSRTTRHVLKHAPSRVMLIRGSAQSANGNGAGPEPEPLFRSGRPSDYWPTGEFVDRVRV